MRFFDPSISCESEQYKLTIVANKRKNDDYTNRLYLNIIIVHRETQTYIPRLDISHKYLFRQNTYWQSTTQYDQSPKYTLLLNLKEKIHWVIRGKKQKFKLKAFGFTFGTKYKDFHAKHQSLENMRQIIACKVNFSKVADFYSPQFIIGTGSSARVFECKSASDNDQYAIKAIDKEYLKSSNYGILQFEAEVLILRQLTQKNTNEAKLFLNLHEVFEGEVTYYLITDLLQGRTLKDEMDFHKGQGRLLPNDSVKMIMKRLLEGVKIMHESQIIHRDLKPENIMFEKIGQYNSLKIVDFGLATSKNVDQYLFPKCGTPGYVAPEILKSNDRNFMYSEVSDIFSCGVIFYKLLTGINLFQAATVNQTLRLNKYCEIDYNVGELATLKKEQIQLLQVMLESDPLLRVSSTQALEMFYFTANNAQPQYSLLQQQQTQQFPTDVQPSNANNSQKYSQFNEQFEEQKDVSPIEKASAVIKQDSLHSFEVSMHDLQSNSLIQIHQLPSFKQPNYRSKSIEQKSSTCDASIQKKDKSLDIQLDNSNQQKSTKNGTFVYLQQSDTSKMALAMINSFYMKEPLSPMIRHQQLLSSMQLQNSLDESKIIPEQLEQSQQQSFIQNQEEEVDQQFL